MIDISKYRKQSQYNHIKDKTDSELMRQQAIREFELYKKTAPNKYKVYINGNATPIEAVITDVNDSELNMLSSIKDVVVKGDIVYWRNKNWLVVEEIEKSTGSCNKVKIALCNCILKIPTLSIEDDKPTIFETFVNTSPVNMYIRYNQEIVIIDPSVMNVRVKYNKYIENLKITNRLWLYGSVWEIVRIDFSKITYDGSNKHGFIEYTVKALQKSSDLDNEELGICDYYKYFPKEKINPIPTPTDTLSVYANSYKVETHSKTSIIASTNPIDSSVIFKFEGDNLGCSLTNITKNSCTLITGGSIGNVYIKSNIDGFEDFVITKITITDSW